MIHLEVGPHGLVYRLELGFGPEQLWGVEHGAVEMDADAEDKKLSDLHVDLRAGQGDLAGHGELRGYVFAGVYGGGYEFFEERGLS